jgi:hypothetical protein
MRMNNRHSTVIHMDSMSRRYPTVFVRFSAVFERQNATAKTPLKNGENGEKRTKRRAITTTRTNA